jgi:hypothetical protein
VANIKNTNLRFNLDNPTHRQAWDYLRNIDKAKFKSYSNIIAVAVVDYFENREREERLVSRIAELVSDTSTRPNPHSAVTAESGSSPKSADEVVEINEEYIDFDFIGG